MINTQKQAATVYKYVDQTFKMLICTYCTPFILLSEDMRHCKSVFFVIKHLQFPIARPPMSLVNN